MRRINLVFGFLIVLAFVLSACSSNNNVDNIDDVNILESEDGSIEGLAVDNGMENVDSDLIDLGELDEPIAGTIQDTATNLGIEEANNNLIEFGELI